MGRDKKIVYKLFGCFGETFVTLCKQQNDKVMKKYITELIETPESELDRAACAFVDKHDLDEPYRVLDKLIRAAQLNKDTGEYSHLCNVKTHLQMWDKQYH